MLIAEDLLLLLTDDDTGKLATSGTELDLALGGALLVELAFMKRVDIAGPNERVPKGRLVVRDASPSGDPVLDDALATAGRKEGKRPQSVVTALGRGTRVRLYERLAEGGVLRAEEGRVLGIFPSQRWPAQDASHEAAVRAALVTALRQGVALDARTSALVSLLHALNVVHKAVGPEAVGLTKQQLNTNAKRIAEGDWAAAAVRSAIDSMLAAIIAASSSTVIAGSSGS